MPTAASHVGRHMLYSQKYTSCRFTKAFNYVKNRYRETLQLCPTLGANNNFKIHILGASSMNTEIPF